MLFDRRRKMPVPGTRELVDGLGAVMRPHINNGKSTGLETKYDPFRRATRSTVLQWKVRGSRTSQGEPDLAGHPDMSRSSQKIGPAAVMLGGCSASRVHPYEPTLDNIYRLTPHSMFGFAR